MPARARPPLALAHPRLSSAPPPAGTVGEPINPEAWLWYHRVVGDGRCPIIDTWWQTETGGFMILPLPGATALKPGSATVRGRAESRCYSGLAD